MVAPTFLQEHVPLMSQISKQDCIAVENAMKQVNVSKGTFYNYMNYLDVQRHKFPFDRKAYILNSDLERIKEFVQGNRS
jgi:ACT domain-containing protein